MANGSDGSIIIDTELDTTGFEKGSEKLLNSMKDFEGRLIQSRENVKSAVSAVLPVLSEIAASTAKISAALTETATQTESATGRVVDSEQRVKQAAEEAAAAVGKQGEAASSFSGSVNNTQSSVAALEREVNSLSSGLQAVSNSAEMGFANGKSVLAFDAKLQGLEQRLNSAREQLGAFGRTQIPTEEYSIVTKKISELEEALIRLNRRRDSMQALGVKENTAQWERLAMQIGKTEKELYNAVWSRDYLERNGTAFISGSQTAEYAQMDAALTSAGETLARNKALIDQEALTQARLNVLTAQEAVAAANTTHEREIAVERLKTAQQELSNLAGSMSNKAGSMAPDPGSVSSWQQFGTAVKSAASASSGLFGSLAKVSFNAIKKGMGGLVDKLKDFVRQGKKSKSMADSLVHSLTSLKRLLITRIKRMFISSIFNGARESLQELAQFSDAFNETMSNIKNAAKGLSANFAVSMGGLISAIEPVLTRIINALSRAISYLNAFFALLRGKSTITVAKKQTDSYADSLGGAAGAAAKLKREVYGFDELNRQSSDDGGGGGGGGGAGDLFEEIPIDDLLPDSVKAFFERLKAAIAAEDWHEVGVIIADGLNAAMRVVDDWINDTLRPLGVKWAGNIAEILNGVTDGLNWTAVGKTIADGLNAIADIYNTFMDTYDFETLGTKLGIALNGLVDIAEWENIGKAFGQKWQALVELIHGLVHKTEWDELGSGIGTAVQGWFDVIDWPMLADDITTGFNGIVEALNGGIKSIEWGKDGATIAESLNKLLTGIEWDHIASLITDTATALLELVESFDELFDAGTILQKVFTDIGKALESVDWGSVIKKIIGYITADFVGGIMKLPGKILGALSGMSNLLGSEFSIIGMDSVAGFFKGIGDKLADAKTWLKEHLVDPVVNGVKNLFGINSPSTVFAEIGGDLIAGLFQGISKAWTAIISFFTTALANLKTMFSTAWNSIKTTASTAWNGIKTTVTSAFEQARSSLQTTAENIKSSISTAWDNIKSKSASVWSSIKTTVSTSFTNLKSSLQTAANAIKSNLSTAWDSVKTTASTKWESVKSTITTKMSDLKSTLLNIDWKSVGTNICTGIRDGINSGWSWLKNTVSSLAKNLKGAAERALEIGSPSRVFRDDIGRFIPLGLAEGIKDTAPAALRAVKSLAEETVNGFEAEKATLQLGVEGNGLVSKLSAISDNLVGIAEVFHGISDYLGKIGEIRVPLIATGEVVPYKTRIDSTVSDATQANFGALMEDVVKSNVAGHEATVAVLKDILEALLGIEIGDDVIGRAAARYNRRMSVITGG